MIYGLALFTLLGTSFGDVTTTSPSFSLSLSPSLTSPTSLTTFLRNKALQTKADITEHSVENFQEDSSSSSRLRSLQLPDNFIGPTYYEDNMCTVPAEKFAILLNYCENQVSLEGVVRSQLYKLNKKSHTFVELNYDGTNCQGIPSKVSDVVKSFIPSFTMETNYGQCFFDSMSGQYATIDYHTTYPTPFPGGFVSTTSPAAECSTTDNTGYFQYTWLKSIGYNIPGCSIMSEDGTVSAYFRSCVDGQVFYDVYPSNDCTGTIDSTYSLSDGMCYDSGTPEKSDDDDFYPTGSLESLYCT